MSKVTIYDICEVNNRYYINSPEARNLDKIFDIPVVPRKMVEMIIERCQKQMNSVLLKKDIDYTDGIYNAAFDIKIYAEELLRQFEKDE